eukprot:TRINITY_DN13698_c0_g1_i1.p1 TRINITY_DN13698_c0_g1~~TRINITY_DN13698_c0_g1_i1.p1  ORF type:complete len:347 (+),score=54.42 TRINITY_DN13698_c0_g1_i1:53-1093(+)
MLSRLPARMAAVPAGLSFAYCASCRRPAPKVTAIDIERAGHKFVELPDGRKLEYVVCGDPDGVPVVFTHGYLSSCRASEARAELCRKNGIKWIAVSQPGFGLSDVYPDFRQRPLTDWPQDVLAVLDHEQIDKVHLMGTSAGCVHAAALAYYLPRSRVGNVLVNTPTCPEDVLGGDTGMAIRFKLMKFVFKIPYLADFVADRLAAMDCKARISAAPDCKRAILRGEKEFPELTADALACMDHSVSFTYRGIVDNLDTIVKPLPFSLQKLQELVETGSAIGITTAPDDTTNPPFMQEWFHRQIPGSIMMHFERGWGHLHILPPDNFERMLRFLLNGKDDHPAASFIVE